MPPDATLPDTLTRWILGHRAAPLVTYYGSDGIRVELSGASSTNAVCKAVNLLVEELQLEPGDAVWLDLPCHWQTPILAIAAWAAGLTICLGPESPAAARATISTGRGSAPLGTGLAVSLHPWGMPLGPATPAGWEDFAALARIQPDAAALGWPDPEQDWLIAPDALSADDLLVNSRSLAQAWALPEAGRLLSDLVPDGLLGLLACTVVPAVVGGSIILSDGGDVHHISQQERNDATAGIV